MGGFSRLKIMHSSMATNNYPIPNHIGHKNQELLHVLNTQWFHGIKTTCDPNEKYIPIENNHSGGRHIAGY
jgi:hypothetical protein